MAAGARRTLSSAITVSAFWRRRRSCELALPAAAALQWLILDERLDSGMRTKVASRSPSATNLVRREKLSMRVWIVSGDCLVEMGLVVARAGVWVVEKIVLYLFQVVPQYGRRLCPTAAIKWVYGRFQVAVLG